jgi:hypothetical protein
MWQTGMMRRLKAMNINSVIDKIELGAGVSTASKLWMDNPDVDPYN